jgi:hypothetical protein
MKRERFGEGVVLVVSGVLSGLILDAIAAPLQQLFLTAWAWNERTNRLVPANVPHWLHGLIFAVVLGAIACAAVMAVVDTQRYRVDLPIFTVGSEEPDPSIQDPNPTLLAGVLAALEEPDPSIQDPNPALLATRLTASEAGDPSILAGVLAAQAATWR